MNPSNRRAIQCYDAGDAIIGCLDASKASEIISKPNSHILRPIAMIFYFMFCSFMMSMVQVIVHDKVPDQATTKPLDDIAWYITSKSPFNTEYGIVVFFDFAEYVMSSLMVIAFWSMWRHQKRCVVFARLFFELGTMFAYRCVTMYVTIIPVMKVEQNYCLPKSDGTPTALFLRGAKTFLTLGMKRSGQNLCGDYMYSGHSATMFIMMHSIINNAPKSMKKLRIIVQIIVLLAILSISISHQHYTIDIVAAYFVTVSIHKSYQTMVAATKLGIPLDELPYRNSWWYPIYNFIES